MGARRLLVALAFVAAACGPSPETQQVPGAPAPQLQSLSFDQLPGWGEDRHGEALTAFRRSCAAFDRAPAEKLVAPASIGGRVADWRGACRAADDVTADEDQAARQFFEARFRPYALSDGGRDQGLFTGYFEPELRGNWRQDADHRWPLYGRPGDLVSVDLGQFRDSLKGQRVAGRLRGNKLVPFDSRADIEQGALDGKDLELLWVDDPVDAFFLHIQGSGRVRMADGDMVRVGYAATNGHPYLAIGRELIARGVMDREEVSMQSIGAWLRANPEAAWDVMWRNRSFVFFRLLKGDGPVGAQGVPLTPGRSLAVDRRFVPLGAPVWIDTTDPLEAERPLRRLLVAQDTGGAIKGVVRGDVFWGFGKEAAERAGRMREEGRVYLLLPRELAVAEKPAS